MPIWQTVGSKGSGKHDNWDNYRKGNPGKARVWLSGKRQRVEKSPPWTKEAALEGLSKDAPVSADDSAPGYQFNGEITPFQIGHVRMEIKKEYVVLRGGKKGELHCNLCSKSGDLGHFLSFGHIKKVESNSYYDPAAEPDPASAKKIAEARRLQEEQLEQNQQAQAGATGAAGAAGSAGAAVVDLTSGPSAAEAAAALRQTGGAVSERAEAAAAALRDVQEQTEGV